MVHSVTGETINSYKNLTNDPFIRDDRTKDLGKEFRSLAQGDSSSKAPDINSAFILKHEEIKNILNDPKITYERIVVDF